MGSTTLTAVEAPGARRIISYRPVDRHLRALCRLFGQNLGATIAIKKSNSLKTVFSDVSKRSFPKHRLRRKFDPHAY
jgi:hypothetical protein